MRAHTHTWAVEELPFIWVEAVVSNVVVNKGDDVIILEPTFAENAVGVADICLMAVIAVSVRTGDEHR